MTESAAHGCWASAAAGTQAAQSRANGWHLSAVGSIFFLAILWVYMYYGSGGWHGARMVGAPRHVWYKWWE
jgi:hypothetical protein